MMRFSITVKIEFKFTNLPSFAFLYRYLFGDLVIVPGRDTLGLSPLRFLHSHDALQGLGQCGNGQGTDESLPCTIPQHGRVIGERKGGVG
jgi:hypothetical protein